jgi:protein TonB
LSITGTHTFSDEEKLKRATTKQKEEDDDNRIFTRVEVYAGFPGGYDAFTRYLKKAAAYPDSATIAEVKGIVKVGFIIDLDGYPKNIMLLRGINKFANEAVLKAISKSPKWMPPNQNGRYVEQYQEVSVTFDISGVD